MSIINLEFSKNSFEILKLSNLSELIEFIYKSSEFKGTMFESFTKMCIYPLISDGVEIKDPETAVSILKEIGFDEYAERLKNWVSYQDLLFASFDEPSKDTINKILSTYIASQMVNDEKIAQLCLNTFNNYLLKSTRIRNQKD